MGSTRGRKIPVVYLFYLSIQALNHAVIWQKSLSPENANAMLWSSLASQTMKQMNIYSVQNTWSNIGHYANSKWIKTSPQIHGTILLPLETYSKQQNNVALLP